jgi:L-lysine exporter family protein LysE/ArgO
MLLGFLTGFFLGLSLILAIGAQNTFVLRQGIIGQHVFYVTLFCALSDAFLICIGIAGISLFLNSFVSQNSNWFFGFSSLWLAGYGIMRLNAAFKSDKKIKIDVSTPKNLRQTLSIIAILTFANPHVYLDTMVLIGSISQQFSGVNKLSFALGAISASFVFFFSLAYGAKLLKPIMQRPFSWRILDGLIALTMFTISIKLFQEASWG